jgi:signal transduction histidine kinase/ligand-binding sensor domain-containing protein
MWITCNDALNRYDGKTIKVYNLDKYFLNCPNLQQGYGFAEDDKTNIYIGSTNGLYIYNRQKNIFTLKKIFQNAIDAIAMPIGYRNGKVYCFNRLFQLATYDVITQKCEFVTQFSIPSLASIHIYQLNGNIFYFHYPFIDKNENVWIIGNDKIESYSIKNKSTKEYNIEKGTKIYSSCYDSYLDRILIGTQKGILILDILTNKKSSISELNGQKLNFINNIVASKDKIALVNDLDIIFTTKDFKEYNLFHFNNFINSGTFFNFSFDKSGRLWTCNDGKGQVVFDFNKKFLNKIPNQNQETLEQFKILGVTSIAEFIDGNVLIQGQIMFDKRTNKISYFEKTALNGIATRLTTDNFRKGIWIFEENVPIKQDFRNIYFFDQNQKMNKVIYIDDFKDFGTQQDLQVLSNKNILCSFIKGLYWLDPESKSLIKVDGIDVENSFKINELSKNRVAVSYINNDMLVFEIQPNHKLRIIKKLLLGIQSFYIQEDTIRNHYWVGTNQGIYLLDKNFKTIKKFDANNGLAGTYIYGLLLDNQGNVFCSHQRGLSSINATTFQVINYDKNDGIQDWDFNNRSFYKATDGTLYFGGVKGFNCFKPPLKPYSYYKPEIYIDEILINNKSYNSNENANLIPKLNLNYRDNNIEIKAYVKDLANANSQELIYKIKEIDSKWKHLSNGIAINFNNLAPNNYTLQLGYYDKYTNKEVFQKTLNICISSPFYTKIWFLILVAFAITGLIFWFFNRRKFDVQKRNFQQQLALEQQRNKITADLHDEIGSSLSSLQINSAVANQLINSSNEKAQFVLDKIELQSQNLADKIGDIIWSMKPGKDEFMTMSSRIKNFANEILGSTNINYEIEIDAVLDDKIKDISTRKNIVLITKEAINNSIKYSEASQVSINLNLKNDQVVIKIKDNGKGFDVNKISGNGMNNMKKRSEELNGNFDVISNEKGTQILVKIPVL